MQQLVTQWMTPYSPRNSISAKGLQQQLRLGAPRRRPTTYLARRSGCRCYHYTEYRSTVIIFIFRCLYALRTVPKRARGRGRGM